MQKTFRLLQSVARILKRPIKPCNLYDPNIKTSTVNVLPYQLSNVAGLQSLKTSEHFTKKINFFRDAYKYEMYASNNYLLITIEGFSQGFIYSLNNPNRILRLMDRCFDIQVGEKDLGVYCNKLDVELNQLKRWFSLSQNNKNIKQLNIQSNESLHVFVNELLLYIKPRPLQNLFEVIQILHQIADNLPHIQEKQVDFKKLPFEFHRLIPLIQKWAISDDSERSEKLEQSSIAEKRRLYQAVKPYLPKINKYLDSFADKPLPEETILLQVLGEITAEVEIELTV